MELIKKIRGKTVKDVTKIILDRAFKTRIDTFHFLTLNLNSMPFISLDITDKVEILKYEDFVAGDGRNLTSKKLNLIKSRIESPDYKAFGIIENNELLYSTWISYGNLTLPNGMHFPLKDNESLLEDSYCNAKARGRGFHSQMNLYRLQQIKKDGKDTVIAIVLDGNIPAMKVQLKSGFKEIFSFKSGFIFGIPFTTKLKK